MNANEPLITSAMDGTFVILPPGLHTDEIVTQTAPKELDGEADEGRPVGIKEVA